MCVATDVCGVCLAKYNGKAWEESYKCVLSLKSWSVVLDRNFQLCVEGQCDLDVGFTICVPITDRLNYLWVTSERTLVKLNGLLDQKDLPDYIVENFSQGIPLHWKKIALKWVDYIQHGESSSYCWDHDVSFLCRKLQTCSSFRNRRGSRFGENKDAKTKEKSVQRKQTGNSKAAIPEEDSALPSSNTDSIRDFVSKQTPASRSQWLPEHKLKEINKWINNSTKSFPAPVPDSESDVESERRNLSKDYGGRSRIPSAAPESSNVRQSETVCRKDNFAVPQSTPLNSATGSKMTEGLNFDVSAIADVSHSEFSVLISDSATEEVFRIPKQDAQGVRTNSAKEDTSSTPKVMPKNVTRMPRLHSLLQTNAKNSELPGSQIVRMESNISLRPRRKQSSQRIERWRPVLGVDGNLKVQGYLLLGGDMTAGQILTTNTVVYWGLRKVRTSDGREFELVGDCYGKIPADLKTRLVEPMNCKDITEHLKEFQALKDRTDWGAEYEYFYEEDKKFGSNSRTLPGQGSEPKSVHQSSSAKQTSNIGCQASPEMSSQLKKTGKLTKSTAGGSNTRIFRVRKRNSVSEINSSESSIEEPSTSDVFMQSSISYTPVRKSARMRRREEQEEVNQSSAETLRSDLSINLSDTPSPKKNRQDSELKHTGQVLKSNNSLLSCEKRKYFENVTCKSSQNQMMLPSPHLQTDNSIVHFSPSRIKVSYINPKSNTPENLSKNTTQRSSNVQITPNNLDSSDEIFIKRSSRSPVKRSCYPCCDGPESSTRSDSHLPLTPSHNVSQKQYKPRELSQSPVTRSMGRRSLRSSASRSTSASKNALKKSPVKSANRISQKKSLHVVSKVRRNPQVLLHRLVQSRKSSRNSLNEKTSTKKKEQVSVEREEQISTKRKEQLSVKTSEQTSAKTREQTRKLAPAKTREQASSKTREQASAKTKEQAPGKTKEQAPSKTKEQAPSKTKEQTPSKTKEQAPSKTKEQAPSKTKEQAPLKTKEQAPLKTKEQAPAKTKEQVTKSTKNKVTPKKKKQTNNKKKIPAKGQMRTRNQKAAVLGSGNRRIVYEEEETSDTDDGVSVISNTSDISVGPSASVIFQMNAEECVPRGAPRTLKERKERDEEIEKLGRLAAARENVLKDDDPMADLIATQKFVAIPEKWCSHEIFLRENPKRRRPSSSEGTASPSRSGISEGYGNEDATSSVATPQLLMWQPDRKQIQSYLHRQRALNAKPHRPTRLVKKDRTLILPEMDYAAVFGKGSESESSSGSSGSEWDG